MNISKIKEKIFNLQNLSTEETIYIFNLRIKSIFLKIDLFGIKYFSIKNNKKL